MGNTCNQYMTILFKEQTLVLCDKEKGRDLTQSYDKHPKRSRLDSEKAKLANVITQRLRSDLGLSVVTTSHPNREGNTLM